MVISLRSVVSIIHFTLKNTVLDVVFGFFVCICLWGFAFKYYWYYKNTYLLLILQKYLSISDITDTNYWITVKITVLDVVFGFIVSVIGETWTFRLQSLCFDLGLEKRGRKASSNSSRPKQTKLQNPTVAIRKYRICRYPISI